MSKINTTVTTEPTLADILAAMDTLGKQVQRIAKVQADMLANDESEVEIEVDVQGLDLAALKAWHKANGGETRGTWTPERIAKVNAEFVKSQSKPSVSKFTNSQVQAPSVSTSGGRFGRNVSESKSQGRSIRPTREQAPGLLASHPYLATMRTLDSADWLDLASHGAGEKRDKVSGRIIRKGLDNPTGMTSNWRFIAKTMSGTAMAGDEIRQRTPNIEFEACNLVQHLVETGKLAKV